MLPRLFLALVLSLAAGMLPAADLYTGEVPAGDDAGHAGAEMAALDQVLSRLTGLYDESLAKRLGLGAGSVNRLVLTRQLLRREVFLPSGDTGEALYLQLTFDAAAIRQLLADNQLPRWGRERPLVLLWTAQERDGAVGMLEEDSRLGYLIAEHARRVGLDIVRPLGDVFDLSEVTAEDIRGGFLASSDSAAKRYGADVVAMLDLRQRQGDEDARHWQGRLYWRVGGQELSLRRSDVSRERMIAEGFEMLASSLASRYAVIDAGGEALQWQVAVSGIVDEVQYAAVVNYLENLSVVHHLQVASAGGREIVFDLEAGEGLESYLELGGLLELERREHNRKLFYRLAH
ncbi:MAG TPA: DUF2066 domain-containing protein [Wenzhouxiangella sp.]|nr:DUF2066 domain-containing protein [Wenzhouxiangella sp.]